MKINLPNYKIITILLTLTLLVGCKTVTLLPSEKYSQYQYEKSVTYENETLNINLKNPLGCPLRIWIFSSNNELQTKLKTILPITLESKSDTIISFGNIKIFNEELKFNSRLGSMKKIVERIEVDLPFPKNKTYSILQPNETNFTHN